MVKLDHLGAQIGESIEPFGEVWLSDAEAKLTARAPKDPKDNPFVEQQFRGVDAQGVEHAMPIVPLTLVESDRPVAERFVPSTAIVGESEDALAARQKDTADALAGSSTRDRTVPLAPAVQPAPSQAPAATAPAKAAGAPASSSEAAEHERASWVDPDPGWTPDPQRGSLQGGAAVGPSQTDDAKTGTATGAPPQKPVQTQAGQVAEETAAELPSGEETGAAETPAGQAPEGEFASHEEVGTPDAPAADVDED